MVIRMNDYDDIPSPSEIDVDSVNSFHVSPHHYLVNELGQDPVEMDTMRYEFGKTVLEDSLFVCPSCGRKQGVELYAIIGNDVDEPHAVISCQDCDWTETQCFSGDPDDDSD